MAGVNYDINYDDSRFTEVESDKNAALSDLEQTYAGMINNSDKYFQQQIDASKQWADKQSQLQQEQTDFAIEQIEQNKEQAKKDYIKEQSGSYVDWQKQSNEYGANAEKLASAGMTNTGYSESSQVSMYNAYQNRVATARESYNLAVQNYNNAITEARLQNNSILAEIAFEALQKELELALEGFQYKNQLILDKTNKKIQLESEYHQRYQDVLQQINTENALAEEIRQYNEQLALEKQKLEEEKRQYNEQMALEREMFEYQKAQDAAKAAASSGSSGGSSSGGSASIQKSSDSEVPVNTQSVIDAGLGPASGTAIANAVKSGQYTATVKDGQVYIEKSEINKKATIANSSKPTTSAAKLLDSLIK